MKKFTMAKKFLSYFIIPLNIVALIGGYTTNKAYWMLVIFVCFIIGLFVGNAHYLVSVLKYMGKYMLDTLKAVVEIFLRLLCFDIIGFFQNLFVYVKGILILGILAYVLIAFYMVPALVYWGMKVIQYLNIKRTVKTGA